MLNFNKDIIINTNLGKVMGNIINYKNKNLLLFKGIPYAHPPIYSLRWKPPILWKSNYSEEIYDATYLIILIYKFLQNILIIKNLKIVYILIY